MEDSFQVCWNCNFSLEENKIVEFEDKTKNNPKINCLHCPEVEIISVRMYSFRERTNLGVFGNLMELINNKEKVYEICPDHYRD